MNIEPGDQITWWVMYRGNGKVGGWQRSERSGTVEKVKRVYVTAFKACLCPAGGHTEEVRIDRILTVNKLPF